MLPCLAAPLPAPIHTDSPFPTLGFPPYTTLPRPRYICQPIVFLDPRDSLQVSVQRENTRGVLFELQLVSVTITSIAIVQFF